MGGFLSTQTASQTAHEKVSQTAHEKASQTAHEKACQTALAKARMTLGGLGPPLLKRQTAIGVSL
jgi:hypothetical protein